MQVPVSKCLCLCVAVSAYLRKHLSLCVREPFVFVLICVHLKLEYIYLYRSIVVFGHWPEQKNKRNTGYGFQHYLFLFIYWDYSLLVDRHTHTHTHTVTKISIFERRSFSSSSFRRRIFHLLDFFRVPFARKHIINFSVHRTAHPTIPSNMHTLIWASFLLHLSFLFSPLCSRFLLLDQLFPVANVMVNWRAKSHISLFHSHKHTLSLGLTNAKSHTHTQSSISIRKMFLPRICSIS